MTLQLEIGGAAVGRAVGGGRGSARAPARPRLRCRWKDTEEQITELQAFWAAKRVRAASHVTTPNNLNARKNGLLAQRAYHSVPAGTRSISGELLEEGWENLSIERQRITARKVLQAVVIHPAKSRGGRFAPARAEPVLSAP